MSVSSPLSSFTTEPPAPATLWIGIDVSQDTLDVCVLRPNGKVTHKVTHKSFTNDPAGHTKVLRWIEHLKSATDVVHFCLEATGSYSQALALFLTEAEQRISVVNPARIHYFALQENQGNKTDRADARLIAEFCRKSEPEIWKAATPEVRMLVALVRRYHAVQELLVQEKNRWQVPGQPPQVLASIRSTISFLEAEIKRLQEQIRDHLDTHDGLKRDAALLQSIPGVGEATAWDLLAELPDVRQFSSAQAVAAYAGLAPREQRSGTSVKKLTQLSRRGNSRLRQALYFPALTATRYNPLIKAHYERLLEGGKIKMVALAACMRKLLMLCYGVLKHQQPFDPTWRPQVGTSSWT